MSRDAAIRRIVALPAPGMRPKFVRNVRCGMAPIRVPCPALRVTFAPRPLFVVMDHG